MNRAQKDAYKRDYAAAKADGKPFFPYAVFKDMIVATAAIGIIIALAIWARVEVGPEVDSASEDFVPRPEWYFFFLFELLKVFKNQDAFRPLIMATFIVPNILLGLLFLWPFIDRGPERRIHKRPMSIMVGIGVIAFLGFMTYKGATSEEAGAEGPLVTITDGNADAIAGEVLVREGVCLNCHTIGSSGAPGPGPNLSNEGTLGRGLQWQIDHLKDPPSLRPGSTMPSFATYSDEELRQIATFMEGLGNPYK